MSEPIRLNKLMSERGISSRREADELIAQGLVKVNGKVVENLGERFARDVQIEVLPRALKQLAAKVTILLHKPKGYVSSQAEDGYEPAIRLITPDRQMRGDQQRLRPDNLRGLATAGRLDIDSQGLLIFTQDGVVAKQLIGEDSQIDKEYLVRVAGHLAPADLQRLRDGSMVLEGRQLRPAQVEWLNDDQLRFVLREGMKRQIRKMCEAVGLRVLGLKRVRIGRVNLGNLPEGQWRFLGRDESFD